MNVVLFGYQEVRRLTEGHAPGGLFDAAPQGLYLQLPGGKLLNVWGETLGKRWYDESSHVGTLRKAAMTGGPK
jgi:hypothetical protein